MFFNLPRKLDGTMFTSRITTLMQNEADRQAFGVRLKELRKQKRWTQKELAAKIGIQLSQLNKYEAGMHVPPVDKLILLAELFGTTTDYLLTGVITDARPLQNLRLLERFRALESFSVEDQDAIIKLLDAMIVKNQMEDALAARKRVSR
jgi:transcriptional regulator with XRE-family HTH domain